MPSKYGWGVDGLGMAHLYIPPDNTIIFTMIDACGRYGQIMLEEQDSEEGINKRSPDAKNDTN